MPVTPQLHRGATAVSSSTTSLEPSHSHTSRIELGIVGVGVKGVKCVNAHAQLAGQKLESSVVDFTGKETQDVKKKHILFLHSGFSQFHMCLQLKTHKRSLHFFFFRIEKQFFFYLFGATSVQINSTHACHHTYRAETSSCPPPSSRLLSMKDCSEDRDHVCLLCTH